MLKKFFSLENTLFVVFLIGLFAVIFGIVPRHAILLLAAGLGLYFLWAPWKRGLLFFIRTIPFYFALPLTANFDNFNFWRIAIAIIFLKWLFEKKFFAGHLAHSHTLQNALPNLWQWVKTRWQTHSVEILGVALFVLATASVLVAYDPVSAMKRLIYFINIVLLYPLLRSAVREGGQESVVAIAKNFLTGALVLCGIGFLQWGAAYLVPAWIFHYWWGHIVSTNLYGRQWSNIVLNSGNTWFSYSGGGLRLRMFSLFPDSHTFPIYLLLALPSLFLVLSTRLKKSDRFALVAAFILFELALILSGTRGIWAGILLPLLLVPIGWFVYPELRRYIKRASLAIVAFILLFPIAWIITSFPQFQQDGVTSNDVFLSRLSSVFNADELSNRGRIAIWEHAAQGIAHNPVIGVGLGNFPVLLHETISSTKAGASAHNLFLNVAAEMGIPALVLFLWLCWEIRGRLTRVALNASSREASGERLSVLAEDEAQPDALRLYAVAALLSFVWILAYSLTDAALFDERAFLGFMVFVGIIPILNAVRA